MDEKEASLLKSSSLKAIWDSSENDDKTTSTNHAESIWNPLSTPLVSKTEQPKAATQATPKILTLEELERRLAAHHVTEDEEELTNVSSDKSTLSTSSDDTTQPSQQQSEEQESSGQSDIISSPIVVSPIRTDFTHGQGRNPGGRPPLIPFMYPPHMMRSNFNPRMPPFRHPLPAPPPGFHPMYPMWPPGGPRGHFMHPPMPPPHGMRPPNYFFRQEVSWDGFMTQKEKDFILKIQFFQLQSKDASIDDYYYQNYIVRKKAKKSDVASSSSNNNGEVTNDSSKLIIPSITRDEKVYQPAEFKDSLGKLKVSCLSNPRQTIDVDMNFESEVTDRSLNSKDIARKRKTQLAALEKMYQLLLDIEDHEKKALALPEQDRDTLKTSKAELISTLFKLFKLKELSEVWKRNDDSYFKELLYYRKGKRLINRVVAILPQEQATIIVFSVMRNITALIRRDEKDMVLVELTKSFCGVVENFSLSVLCQLLNALLKGPPQANPHIPAAVMAAKSKFGEKVLIKMLQRGQLLCKESSDTEVTSSLETCHRFLAAGQPFCLCVICYIPFEPETHLRNKMDPWLLRYYQEWYRVNIDLLPTLLLTGVCSAWGHIQQVVT